MKSKGPEVRLKNGVKLPLMGLGTTHNGGYVHETVVYALKEVGYKHIDTARRYGVEQFIGKAIKDSGIDRSELFLSTKLWPNEYGQGSAKKAAIKSIARLDTDYLDLYMLHWPVCPRTVLEPKQCITDTWRELEILLDEERIRSIGVSNFQVEDLEQLIDSMEISGVLPHVNQCEFHPFQNPWHLRQFCEDHDIHFGGYCPLAKGHLLNEKNIVEIATKMGKSPAQILIRWSLQHNVSTIPKSTKKSRILENFQSIDFELSEDSMLVLDDLHINNYRVINLEDMQERIDKDLPDGYKMKMFPCSLPNTNTKI